MRCVRSEGSVTSKDEARRARQAAYSRAWRARKRAERAAAAVDAAHAQIVPQMSMADAIATSVAAMKWLAPSDGAAVLLARLLASQIDALTAAGDIAGSIRHSSALLRILRELGGTPMVRLQHELRSRRVGVLKAERDEAQAVEASPNVTRFVRPAKRQQ